MVVASDWARNIEVYSGVSPPRPLAQKPLRPPPSAPAAVHTVCFLMSDGDNLQWLINGFFNRGWYGSEDRGRTDIGWTISAAAAELAPSLMDLAYARAARPTAGSPSPGADVFVAAVSGSGYAYPDIMSPEALGAYAKQTADFMAKADLRILNVLAASAMPSAANLGPLLSSPQVDGAFYYLFDDYSGSAPLRHPPQLPSFSFP